VSRRSAGAAEQRYGRLLADLVDPVQFPEVTRLFASPVFEPPRDAGPSTAADRDFAFGLEIILDGVASAIRAAHPH
jgi:hypothetical protein